MTHRLLCVVAHPDDETFGAGGILVDAAANGVETFVVCATRGEAGEIAERSTATPETLPQAREAELREAAKIMSVKRVDVLGYRDSGMPGTADNKDPRSFINQPREKVVSDLVKIIEEVQPDVVVTMEDGGGYGHPDHIFMTSCTIEAFHAVRSNAESKEAPRKLYFFTFPRSRMRKWIYEMRALKPDSDLTQLDPEQMGVPEEEISLSYSVEPYEAQWRKAVDAHVSQHSPMDGLSDELQREFFHIVNLTRVFPEWDGNERESGMFDGL